MVNYFGKKTWENIIDSVTSVQEVTLSEFIEALGIANVGSMAKLITDVYPTIEDVDKITSADLLKIDGFGDVQHISANIIKAKEIRDFTVQPSLVDRLSSRFKLMIKNMIFF